MIKDDGEKYACESCIRGHRVSQCQHNERELHHINRKGRPVSQCPHCRGLRKARATHVKCTCGDKSSEERTHCGCMTGHRCVCALKKEDQSESEDGLRTPARSLSQRNSLLKPAIASRKSESAIPRIRNGHHPPMHRLNNAAHEVGMPYQVPRLNLAGHFQITQTQPVDQASLQPVKMNNTQTTTPKTDAAQNFRLSKSEHNSPILGALSKPSFNNQIPAQNSDPDILLSHNGVRPIAQTRYSMNDFSDFLNSEPFEFLNQPIMSANLEQGPFSWEEYNIGTPFTFNGISGQPVPPSISSTVSQDHPDLSRSSSGTISESGEPSILADFSMMPHNSNQVPLELDPAWNISNSFTTSTGFPSFSQPSQLDSSYSVCAIGLSDPSSYFSEQINNNDIGSGSGEGKWLPLTAEPWLPQGSDAFAGILTPTQLPLATNDGGWPAISAYDFSNYGPQVDGQDGQGVVDGMNWM